MGLNSVSPNVAVHAPIKTPRIRCCCRTSSRDKKNTGRRPCEANLCPTYDKISHQLHLIKYSIQLSASFYRNSGTCSTGVQSLKLILPEQFSTNIIFVSLQAKAGFGMNIFCVVVLIICVHVYGVPMFDLNTFPHWAGQHAVKNVTLVCRNETVS